MQQQSFNSLKE